MKRLADRVRLSVTLPPTDSDSPYYGTLASNHPSRPIINPRLRHSSSSSSLPLSPKNDTKNAGGVDDRASIERLVMAKSSSSAVRRHVSCNMRLIIAIAKLMQLKSRNPSKISKNGYSMDRLYVLFWIGVLLFAGLYSYCYYYLSVTSGDFLDLISDYATGNNPDDLQRIRDQFYHSIIVAIIATLASSISYSAMLYFSQRLAQCWRWRVTEALFDDYFHPFVYYEINQSSPEEANESDEKNVGEGKNEKSKPSGLYDDDDRSHRSEENRSRAASATAENNQNPSIHHSSSSRVTPASSAPSSSPPSPKAASKGFIPKKRNTMDNIDQRLANDVRLWSTNLSYYLFGSLYYNGVIPTFSQALAFTILIIRKGGGIGVAISYASFAFFVVLNAFLGQWVAQANYQAESAAGFYQYSHTHLRTHCEHVAFYNGHSDEQDKLMGLLNHSVHQSNQFIGRSYFLNVVTNFYYWLATILCYALPGALFFGLSSDKSRSAANDLYSLTVYNSYLQLTFSYAILLSEPQSILLSYGSRVAELYEELKLLRSINEINRNKNRVLGENIKFDNVSCYTPNGNPLVKDLSLTIQHKENVIIMGVSGAGKSSILRLLCGLWPVHAGIIQKPPSWEGGVYFVPQKPYLSLGSLREQFSYPRLKKNINHHNNQNQLNASLSNQPSPSSESGSAPPSSSSSILIPQSSPPSTNNSSIYSSTINNYHDNNNNNNNNNDFTDDNKSLTDEEISCLLDQVDLGYLLKRFSLDTIADWGTVLSVGEQQRIGMARLFYHRPAFALLDESTSAVDIDMEIKFYERVIELGIQFISVAHRPTVIHYHHTLLKLLQNGNYQLVEIQSNNTDLKQLITKNKKDKEIEIEKEIENHSKSEEKQSENNIDRERK